METDVLYQWRDFLTHEVRVTAISNLTLRNVEVESAKWLIRINGDAREPVKGVTLENVRCAKTGQPDVIRNAKTPGRERKRNSANSTSPTFSPPPRPTHCYFAMIAPHPPKASSSEYQRLVSRKAPSHGGCREQSGRGEFFAVLQDWNSP